MFSYSLPKQANLGHHTDLKHGQYGVKALFLTLPIPLGGRDTSLARLTKSHGLNDASHFETVVTPSCGFP